LLVRVQDRSPLADRTVQAVDNYLNVQGSLLSAGMTYYGFLALFPLVAVALGVASLLSKVIPRLDDQLREYLARFLPSVDLDAMASAGITVGLIGLAVMLYAGVRWIGALRKSLTVLSGQPPRVMPFLPGLVRDSLSLTLLGLAVLGSLAFTLLGQFASTILHDWFGSEAGTVTLRVVSLVAAFGIDLAIAWVIYRSIPGHPLHGRRLLVTAAVAAVGFEVLKQAGGLIVAAASTNIVYGTFAATVGVLIWISYTSKWILFVGVWALVGTSAGASGSEPGAAPGGGGEPDGDPPVLAPAAQGDHGDPDGEGTGQTRDEPQREGEAGAAADRTAEAGRDGVRRDAGSG
jgi:membrane protein